MTESKIRKRIFDINLGPVRNKTSAVSGVSIFILGLDAIWKSRKDSVEICSEMYFPLLSVRSVADFFLVLKIKQSYSCG
jgi:hypothetical protein